MNYLTDFVFNVVSVGFSNEVEHTMYLIIMMKCWCLYDYHMNNNFSTNSFTLITLYACKNFESLPLATGL